MSTTTDRTNYLRLSDLYVQYCSLYCAYLDIQAHVHAMRCEYSAAAELISRAIALMVHSGQYENSDVVVGRERVKLAQLQLNSGDIAACRLTASRAVSDLKPFVSASDPDWIDVNNILRFAR